MRCAPPASIGCTDTDAQAALKAQYQALHLWEPRAGQAKQHCSLQPPGTLRMQHQVNAVS